MKTTCLSIRILAALMLFSAAEPTVRATVVASAVLTQSATGNPNTYNITLQNNSTAGETFTTFWFSWLPGQDYMAVSPTNVVAPSGWTFTITHAGSSDGYAIRFIPSTPMAAGTTVNGFSFQSTSTLADFQGNSVFFPSTPVMTAQVFSTIDTTLTVTVQDPFDGSSLGGGGWYFSQWLGTYNSTFYPWIYTTEFGFMYTDVVNSTDIYFYVPNGNNGTSFGWVYTTPTVAPNIYSFSRGSWLYYTGNGTSFYNYTTQSFETF